MLSEDLQKFFNGENLEEKQHEAMMLLTVNEDGFPHTAMVSVGEVVATDSETLRLALWSKTHTTSNIIRSKKAMLVFFYKGKACYITLSLEELPTLADAKYPLKRFTAQVLDSREDLAKYADITSGVSINLKDPESVLDRWQQTLAELLI